jgi:DNA-directed RNA polymerase specialized sigma24 family protein
MRVQIDFGLTPEQVAAILSYDWRQYTIGEIAKKLGLPYAVVRAVMAVDKKRRFAEYREPRKP